MELSVKVLDLWAKKDVRDDQELWLPLLAHLTDAMNVINWLYQHWLNDAQRRLLQQAMSDQETERLIKFAGFFHDFGKATPAFQAKRSYRHDEDLDNDIMERLLRDGFTNLQDFDVASPDRRRSPHAKAGEALLEVAGLNVDVGSIIGGHHGRPCDANFLAGDQITNYYANYYQVDKHGDPQIIQQWQSIYDDLIAYGLDQIGYHSLTEVPSITQQQAVILEGLLIMADWLASSEYLNDDESKPLFPLIPVEEGMADLDEQARYQNAIQTWLVDDRWKPQPVESVDQLFRKRWGFSPRAVQKKMVRAISQIANPGMVIIESGCGTGKTEIALSATEELAANTNHNGFFMGLPTQATTNAMHDRVEKWIEKIADEQQSQLELNLMHGKAKLNQHAQSLPRAENVAGRRAVVINSWFSGKKSILTEFTVATIDHLLLMSLKQKHLFLRHLAMSGKVVVIDEIHAYDAYMSSYLNQTLRWLGTYHVPVIALSATLPAKKRQSFLNSYCRGKYGRRALPSVEDLSHDYPLLTFLDGDQIHQVGNFPQVPPQTFKVTRLGKDDDLLVGKIREELSAGGVAGVIVNTVKRAQQLSQMFDDIPVLLLHSAFLGPDRSKKETELMGMIGKNGQRPQKMVVIGTQVLSQSLDIDFDVLFTDIAPVDLLIQRIGRLHRHQIKRPAKLAKPQVFVMGLDKFGDYGGANEAIYEKYYLMKTDHFLGEQIVIPNDVSPLVQQVYDPKTNAGIQGINEPYWQTKLKIKQEKRKAKGFQIEPPHAKHSLLGWLDNDQEAADRNEAVAQASVRDIKESIEVILLQHSDEGDFLVDHQGRRPLAQVSDKEVSEETIRLPYAVNQNIDKTIADLETRTARYYPQWQDSIWLHDALALPLGKDRAAELNGYRLSYSPQLGLTYEKEE